LRESRSRISVARAKDVAKKEWRRSLWGSAGFVVAPVLRSAAVLPGTGLWMGGIVGGNADLARPLFFDLSFLFHQAERLSHKNRREDCHFGGGKEYRFPASWKIPEGPAGEKVAFQEIPRPRTWNSVRTGVITQDAGSPSQPLRIASIFPSCTGPYRVWMFGWLPACGRLP